MILPLRQSGRVHRSDARRRGILGAALRCFVARGYDATSISDIRRESRASVGSIYHHFGGKDGIAAEIYLELVQTYQQSLLQAVMARRSARSFVWALVSHHLRWSEANPDWARYLHDMRGHASIRVHEEAIQVLNRETLGRILGRLREFREAGELQPLTVALLFPLILAPMNEMVHAWLEHPQQIDLRKCRRPLMEAVWRSVGRETPA